MVKQEMKDIITDSNLVKIDMNFLQVAINIKMVILHFHQKIGFRYEISDINREKNSSQDERMFNLRFYPNFTYNINNDIQLYLNGHTGPMINRVQQGTRLKNDGTSATYWHDWYQEMEILGVKI